MYNSFLCILLIYTEKRLGVLDKLCGYFAKNIETLFYFLYKRKNYLYKK